MNSLIKYSRIDQLRAQINPVTTRRSLTLCWSPSTGGSRYRRQKRMAIKVKKLRPSPSGGCTNFQPKSLLAALLGLRSHRHSIRRMTTLISARLTVSSGPRQGYTFLDRSRWTDCQDTSSISKFCFMIDAETCRPRTLFSASHR